MVQPDIPARDAESGFVALGSNQSSGHRAPRDILGDALSSIADSGFDVTSYSRYFESPAFPPGSGPAYVNAVVAVTTKLDPKQAIARLHQIEAAFGRVRGARWSARILDLDLLALGDRVLPDRATHDAWAALPLEEQKRRTPDELILPHPRMAERAFVLVPLAEIAPDWVHPVSGRTAVEMRDALAADDLGLMTPI